VNGKLKKYCACRVCPWVFCLHIQFARWHGTSRNNKSLVDAVTTLRRHLKANHSIGDLSTLLCCAWTFPLARGSIETGQRVSISCWSYQEISRSARRLWKR
jgi:hypothetical protein